MLKAESMQKFYAIVPTQYEERVLEELGKLGIAHLEREHVVESARRAELYDRYVALLQRIDSLSRTLRLEKKEKISLMQLIKEMFTPPPKKKVEVKEAVSLEELEELIRKYELEIDKKVGKLEALEKEAKELEKLKEKLELLAKFDIRLDEIGEFKYTFVKVGLLNKNNVPRLEPYVIGMKASMDVKSLPGEECLIVVTGLKEELPELNRLLEVLNFEEFKFPAELELPPNPKQALDSIKERLNEKKKEIDDVKREIGKLGKEFLSEVEKVKPHLEKLLALEEARSYVGRTRTSSVIHGWVPKRQAKTLKSAVEKVADERAVVRFSDPTHEDKIPTKIENKSIFKYFELFTELQGTPSYHEVNPTPFYTVFYVIMFGMMFGDIGQGALLFALGLVLTRVKRGIMGSAELIRKLGGIMTLCGLSAIFFGFLYGEFFLLELGKLGIMKPLLFSPLHEQYMMMAIALLFGIIQMFTALALHTINKFMEGETFEALFSEKGISGMVYYASGIALIVKYMEHGMSLSFFGTAEAAPYLALVLGSLCVILFAPFVKGVVKKEGAYMEKLMAGFSYFLEAVIAFLANTVSYVRLAAFAIAHGAFGEVAAAFASMLGGPISYLVVNALVMVIEGFSSFIQSLRLIYYEFSTKFYMNNGVKFSPFKLHVE